MIYETTRFGPLEVKENEILNFPVGLYGFERERDFIRLPFNPNIESPMEWLQSLKTPGLAFVITDPFLYVPDYSVKLTEEEKKQIRFEPGHTLMTRAIVTLPENYLEMTANLVAPIIVNLNSGLARQFVLTSMEYDTRHYLLPQEVREGKVKTPE
ncbi:MAG: flagellar assembly factor FliW [Nitrospinaceae bacterium]|nr:MAG: flagellar assembly factor FliW [Nitrospinaceae bacterium]